jgi:hypothetical protein
MLALLTSFPVNRRLGLRRAALIRTFALGSASVKWFFPNSPRTPPLRQWTLFGRYDSAQECSDERTKMIRVQYMALLSDLAEDVSEP